MTIKELHLKNIVLVEATVIPFYDGFNVLSGESGSGKSAIINALNLIAGDRSDISTIRRGAEKGVVEAVFDISGNLAIEHALDEAGIDHERGNDLYLRREITVTGKSRAFINNQLAQLTILRQITPFLFEIVGQHANQKLLTTEYHRQVIDLYGGLEKDLSNFAECYNEELETKEKLENLIQTESQRIRKIETLHAEIEEIEEAQLKDGEEEELFTEYTMLSNAEDLVQRTSDILKFLTGEKFNIISQLGRLRTNFEQLAQLDVTLADTLKSFENARLELEEVAHTIQRYQNRVEHNPEKAESLSKRLELINKLKRKYGPSVEDVLNYLATARKTVTELENVDADIDLLRDKLKKASESTHTLAHQLSQKRKEAITTFEKAIIKQLRSLNMQKAEFFAEMTLQKRTRHGDDKIEFFLIPNVGEHRISLKDCASGGELSRTLLAVQTLLAGKEQIPTLIFDEIDANIGGETATVVGEKLSEISRNHQVICITHFPQVAKQSHHHLRIHKEEVADRTVTLVSPLDEYGKQKELARMVGKQD